MVGCNLRRCSPVDCSEIGHHIVYKSNSIPSKLERVSKFYRLIIASIESIADDDFNDDEKLKELLVKTDNLVGDEYTPLKYY